MAQRFYFEPPRRRLKSKLANMKSLLVRCPSTSKLTDTGRTIKEEHWSAAKVKTQKFTCTHCGKVHSWSKADVVLGRPIAS